MYVRWKRRRRKDHYHYEYDHLEPEATRARKVIEPQWLRAAWLVESVRVAGSPRQRTLAYLGSVRECYLAPDNRYRVFHCTYFWRSATAKLDALALEAGERARIEAALEAVVPRPSAEAFAQAWAESEARIAALTGRAGPGGA